MRRDQRVFRLDNKEDRHTCYTFLLHWRYCYCVDSRLLICVFVCKQVGDNS